MESYLTLAYAGIIAFGVFMYVLMDGFDLGVGILFRTAPTDRDRDVLMNSLAPIWDGNETWLVLGGAGLLGAFPQAYSILLSAFYLPLSVMLIALIFRGVAFEFRFKANRSRYLWDIAFNLGSAIAAFAQGVVLGAFVQGVDVVARQYAGGPFDWLTPFSLVTGVAMMVGYALLGVTWLIVKTDGALQDWAYGIAMRLVFGVVVFMAIISLWTPMMDHQIAERWFSWPNIAFLSPVPVAVGIVTFGLHRAIRAKREVAPFVLAMVMFLLGYIGLAISLWPNVVPPSISIWEAASAVESQRFLIYGFVILLPVILGYTSYTYWVFRGKVSADEGHY
ncbi:MAG: cytochrome d ubiquinol oxidase subunit II [Rhodospirillaceae bacterium]|jgi:cytochrome d ubiquinol oxidase subunit II|nr:cytochrome d ubiquinol oxidase subunit II [Rhodospirillaceae bacterium]HAL47952.1 cytochrome d ubiquinol oxidase subunit II [Dehalococcoidia bacterium]|tara:strand:- start:3484 stop:4488 length:1005 start_codon:yes stop_codon:yes gene_type:complete